MKGTSPRSKQGHPRSSRDSLAEDFVGAALRMVHKRLDDIDLHLVTLLHEDGRMATREMARRCGLAEGPVRRRLARLLDEGIIKVTVLTDPPSVNLRLSALVMVKCRMDSVEELSRQVSLMPEVRYVAMLTGEYDLILEAFFYSRRHLTSFLTKKLAKLDGVIDTQTSIVLDVAKLSFEWEVPAPVSE